MMGDNEVEKVFLNNLFESGDEVTKKDLYNNFTQLF